MTEDLGVLQGESGEKSGLHAQDLVEDGVEVGDADGGDFGLRGDAALGISSAESSVQGVVEFGLNSGVTGEVDEDPGEGCAGGVETGEELATDLVRC